MFIFKITKKPIVPVRFLLTDCIFDLMFDPYQTNISLRELSRFYSSSIEINLFESECKLLKHYCCYNIENSVSYMRLFDTAYPESEYLFARRAATAFYYAETHLRGRFELGEEAISKSPLFSFAYARFVLNGRFELGEEAIKTDAIKHNDYIKFLESGKVNQYVHDEFTITV